VIRVVRSVTTKVPAVTRQQAVDVIGIPPSTSVSRKGVISKSVMMGMITMVMERRIVLTLSVPQTHFVVDQKLIVITALGILTLNMATVRKETVAQ